MVDYSKYAKKTQKEVSELDKPRPIFLIVAAIAGVAGFATYFYEDQISAAGSGSMGFVVLLLMCVLVAAFGMTCYRSPRLGNRLLGYGVLEDKERKVGEGYHYSGGFKEPTGAELKKQHTRRIQSRHARKKYARATRAMQSETSKTDQLDTLSTKDE